MSKEIKNLQVNVKIEFDEEKAHKKIERIAELMQEIQFEMDTFSSLFKFTQEIGGELDEIQDGGSHSGI
ncbi:hypothetical protein [Peptacetobacter sp. AB845]|uniref:hypothetical protein n=1 Tax=Peptacetobacter sp. AB845 TaxID=3388429 RepID=UPI0039C8E1FA